MKIKIVRGQGKTRCPTKSGPGRMPSFRNVHFPPGTKLIRRFIDQATGENHTYRKDLLNITGKVLRTRRHVDSGE